MPNKKSFFAVFKEEEKKVEDEDDEEEKKTFRFNRPQKESIKNHFSVVSRETRTKNSRGSKDPDDVKDPPKAERKKSKSKSTVEAEDDVNKEEDKNSSRTSEQFPKITKKRSFFAAFHKENKDDDGADDDEEERVKFKFNKDPEQSKETQSKSKSSQKAKVRESPRKSSQDKNSNKPSEVVVKPGPLLKKTPSFSSAPASPRKSLRRNRRSIVKMVTMSQTFSAIEESQSPMKSSEAKTKSLKKKKSTKKKKDEGLTKINSIYKAVTIDDLLRLPETVGDTGLTMDQILDKVDLEIKDQQKKYEDDMKMLDQTIEKQRERKRAFDKRMEENAVLKEKLIAGLTRPVLVEMFEKNVPYLTDIREGRVVSARHNSFHKSPMTRQALLYTMITHPFTDEQLDWTYEEFKTRWMKTMKQFHEFNDYMWKVLIPECFIKFYMDFFKMSKEEAETRIKETPMDDED